MFAINSGFYKYSVWLLYRVFFTCEQIQTLCTPTEVVIVDVVVIVFVMVVVIVIVVVGVLEVEFVAVGV